MSLERAADGRIIIRLPPLPEPDPDPIFTCMMCGETVQQWKSPAAPDICIACFMTLKQVRRRRGFHEKTYYSDQALDIANGIIATIEQECKNVAR